MKTLVSLILGTEWEAAFTYKNTCLPNIRQVPPTLSLILEWEAEWEAAFTYIYIYLYMGWLLLVGPIKLYVSFAERCIFYKRQKCSFVSPIKPLSPPLLPQSSLVDSFLSRFSSSAHKTEKGGENKKEGESKHWQEAMRGRNTLTHTHARSRTATLCRPSYSPPTRTTLEAHCTYTHTHTQTHTHTHTRTRARAHTHIHT